MPIPSRSFKSKMFKNRKLRRSASYTHGELTPETLGPHLEKLSLGPRSPILNRVENTTNEVPVNEKKRRLQAQVVAMVKNLEMECHKIIFDVFPTKIQYLDEVYKTRKEFNLKKEDVASCILLPEFPEATGSKEDMKRQMAKVTIPANKALSDIFQVLQTEILEMSEMINALSIWVKLNVPRFAGGNNLGVEVQHEISEVLQNTEVSCYEILDSFTTYHTSRANLVAQIMKYPGIGDFQEALKELDEKTYIKTSLLSCELRNDYITLYDLLSKNLELLTIPKGHEEEKLARMY